MKKTVEQQVEHLISLHERITGNVIAAIEHALICAAIAFEHAQELPMDGKFSVLRKDSMLYWSRVTTELHQKKSDFINSNNLKF